MIMHSRKALCLAVAALASWATGATVASAQGAHQITVTIHDIKALDKFDTFSRGDIFARVTIAGEIQATQVWKQAVKPGDIMRPNWTITRSVKPGTHAIQLEILDKDITKDEVIDVNRLPNKRVQDFTVNTRNCAVGGFAGSPRCGNRITRAGSESKSAEVVFSVAVKK